MIGAGVLFAVIRVLWRLRQTLWFWILAIGITWGHVAVILRVSWGDQWLGYAALLPVAMADFALCYGMIRGTERLIEKIRSYSVERIKPLNLS